MPLTAFDIGHPAAEYFGETLFARPGAAAEMPFGLGHAGPLCELLLSAGRPASDLGVPSESQLIRESRGCGDR
ncbi:hypothetical protein GCM10023322_71130 [Rugosimonospora acidiphila]|uniref:Uncharacterized protein n=1 Tax=Rugosimonospora acidiphila TaxID=556531 RepID=A0ABP9SLQ8_9ACTN